MKKITITVNDYIYNKIKDIKNKSDFINNMILLGIEKTLLNDTDLIKKILELQNKIIELEKELNKNKLNIKIKWKCPICRHINFEHNYRCSQCNLPTRNDKKTEWGNFNNDILMPFKVRDKNENNNHKHT